MRTNSQHGTAFDTKIRGRLWWLLTFLGFTAFGLLSFEYRYLDDLARAHPHTFAIHMFEEMSGAYVAMLIYPFLVWGVRRTRIRRTNWWRMLPLNLLFLVILSICDTTLMSLTRSLLAPLLGLGRYDYGNMFYRYPMEFAKHVPLYWTAVAAIYVVDAYQDARNRQLRTADLEARLAEARLQNLRLQLQPHFLFNALNTISSVMYEDVERADNMLARLGDLLRRTLNAAEAQEISLQEELGLVESYLAIMQERFGEDLQIAFEIDPELMQALVPQLVLQPLVENSLRYGRDLVTSKVTLRISASRSSTGVLLQVRDGGPGIVGLEANGWRKGIGIGNTEQRLLALYGEAEPLLLENTNGLTVSIRIPLRWGSARI
ncbi:histidine kinase [Granulicella arctica]|uniref:G-patch domain-containing protein n=1 Tax=Granulicella arctica TaxID=940613 RepID=A0A7Y9PHJ9_9BACT|nr:hypothetical protein [Granulicella arctica]